MENASKALLMAAEILIGVLVLTLGMYLYISLSATSNEIEKDEARKQIDMYNAQFTSIANKENITIYDIITLVNLAKQNNGSDGNIQYQEGDINYISISLETKDKNYGYIENYKEKDLNDLIKKEQSAIGENNPLLPTYECTIHINETTLKVDKIKFKYK